MSAMPPAELWGHFVRTPLLGLSLTLSAYLAGMWLFKRSGQKPFLNPILVAIILIALLLWATETPYQDYFDGAQFIHFLLGPATVALAVPRVLSALLENNLQADGRVKLPAVLVPYFGQEYVTFA